MHANHSSSSSRKIFNLLLLVNSINQITRYCFKCMQSIQTIGIMINLRKYCLMSVHLMNLSSLMTCLVSWNKTFGLSFHIHDIVVCSILIWFYTTSYNLSILFEILDYVYALISSMLRWHSILWMFMNIVELRKTFFFACWVDDIEVYCFLDLFKM